MRSRQGFTLIEILIVTVVLGILAAIAIPKYTSARRQAFTSAVRSDLENLALAQEAYFDDAHQYANTITPLEYSLSAGVAITINETVPGGWGATGEHASLPGLHCGIFYGSADPTSGDPATTPGVVDCAVP